MKFGNQPSAKYPRFVFAAGEGFSVSLGAPFCDELPVVEMKTKDDERERESTSESERARDVVLEKELRR